MTTTIDYALMAGASYRDTRPDINKFPTPAGWNMVSRYPQDGVSGFEAATFGNGATIANSTEIVISYSGTDPENSNPFTTPDGRTNAALSSGNWADQLMQAAEYQVTKGVRVQWHYLKKRPCFINEIEVG